MAAPSQNVVSAIEAGITRVTRRVEIYESDGVTPFYPNGSNEDTSRLVDGGVTVDSTRDERRAIDLTLDNVDNKLRPNADGGFWYDKIIIPYRGVRFASNNYKPKILIIEAPTTAAANSLKSLFYNLGFTNVTVNLSAANLSDLSGYEIIVADGGVNAITKAALLQSAFSHGFKIFTKGLKNGIDELPWVTGEFTFTDTSDLKINPRTFDTPVSGGWTSEAEQSAGSGFTGTGITAIDATAQGVATSLNNTTTHFTATLKAIDNARWFDYKPNVIGTSAKALLVNALKWLWNYSPYQEWETPLGTYMIDNMKTQSFPHQLTLSGRDQTKRLLGSKLKTAMSFDATTLVNDFITALAENAGITKIRLASSSQTLGKVVDVARTTDRFATMKLGADIQGRDVYFDLEGYLTTSDYADPAFGSPIASFKTGKQGNLASYDRSTNDSRVYNHVIVTGTTDDPDTIGYFGEAINDNPSSPTRIQRLGDRTYFYTSSLFTSDAQCQAYADTLIKQVGFEEYDLNLSSFVYPWIDAGIVIDFDDPEEIELDPTRFLGSSFNVPLGLDMMGATGKRVVFIEGLDDSEAA